MLVSTTMPKVHQLKVEHGIVAYVDQGNNINIY